jgi:phosphoribosylanthranilate isomerase
MFRIKICGITNISDARAAADAGADAIGLNFFNKSRRFVDVDSAWPIAAELPVGITKVGVFVNHTEGEVLHIVERVGLDAVQLHGDEPPTLLAQLPPQIFIILAHRCRPNGLSSLASYLQQCASLQRLPNAILLDADAGANYGGSGELADWALVDRQRGMLSGLPLILAGGLTPDNVAAGIAAVGPDAVDTASGVEREPGRKDAALIARFVTAARSAFKRLE